MKYSYEFKIHCIQLYRRGEWAEAPEGIQKRNFHKMIRLWVRLEELHGPEILKRENNINWSPDQKLEMVSKVIAGNSIKSVAIENGINPGQLYSWLRKYKIYGYNGLVNKKKGRRSNKESMNKKTKVKPKELNESEREELIRLREENEYLKMKILFEKKFQALLLEEEAEARKKRK